MKTLVKSVCLLALLMFAREAKAQSNPCGIPGTFVNYAKETLTVSNTSLPFTTTVYDTGIRRPVFAQVRLETANIRFWANGNVPTATVGWLVEFTAGANNSFTVCGEPAVRAFQMIRTAADATATILYWGSQ